MLVDRYHALGGQALVNTTVEEVVVRDHRAVGVRLTDGTMLDADVIVSTASGPETVFRLLGGRYGAAEWKTRVAERVLGCIERYLPGTRDAVRMTDIATPLTFWRSARSWCGAYEGWVPTPDTPRHVPKQLAGLDCFYMAGQWVEPGGGIPLAIMSGRHTAELLCAAFDRPFASPLGIQPARAPGRSAGLNSPAHQS